MQKNNQNWYIKLYKAGYSKALKLLKNKYKKFVLFDWKRKKINGKEIHLKANEYTIPKYLQVHHDYELQARDISLDYLSYWLYFPEVNLSKNLTYCNIFEHYILHVLIQTTKINRISEEDFFTFARKDLKKSEIKRILEIKEQRIQQILKNKDNDFFRLKWNI